MASEDLSLLDQVASELLLLPLPSSAQGPRWYISLYMTHAPRTHPRTLHARMHVHTHTAGPYINVSATAPVCVSPIIWPLDSNG